jgi:uncharacterized protein (DUF1697 family)
MAGKRYVAFLRGVSPMNAKMPELKRAFEAAGFSDVKTVLSSGNVVFSARASSSVALQKRAESAMEKHLGRSFMTLVRPVDDLRAILASDPFQRFRLPGDAKRIVTFLREEPERDPRLPIEVDGARILERIGHEVFTAYVPSPKGAVFMRLIESTYGQEVTTRTWDTVSKVSK